MSADALIKLVGELRAPYGLERSVKIAPGALFDDRCLISIHRTSLGKSPADRLAEMGRQLNIPDGFADQLQGALDSADVVHFGHEKGPVDIYKIYFEYASRARRAMATFDGEPVLVHVAYKWSPGIPGSASVTRYTWLPCGTQRDLEAKLRSLLPANRAPRALRCVLSLLSRVATVADTGQPMMMDVEERGNPRRSFDLNVYDAGLRLGQIADLIEATTTDFAVPRSRSLAVFDPAKKLAMGHLSGGIARNGEEFVTIYYGIEEH